MKTIRSKIEAALEWSQHYSLVSKRSRAANSVVGNGILMKFKLRQALRVIRVTMQA